MKTFLKNIFNVDVEQVLTAVMNEYTDYRQTDEENKIMNRDTLLSIFRYSHELFKMSPIYNVLSYTKKYVKSLFSYFSDARVAAPLVKSATIHGEHGNIGNTFLYVFQHVTKYGYYPEVRKKDLN